MNNKLQKATVAVVAALIFFVTFVGTSKEQVVVEANKVISDSNNINNNYLIGSQTLENELSNKNIVILDIRNNSEYVQGHIPGAINITWNQFIGNNKASESSNNNNNTNTTNNNTSNNSNTSTSTVSNNTSNANTNDVNGSATSNNTNTSGTSVNNTSENNQPSWMNSLNKNEITKELQNLGINENSQIIIYGYSNGSDLGDLGKFSWLFKMIGINSKMLNGGFKNWEAQGFNTTTVVPTITKSNIVVENFVTQKMVSKKELQTDISKVKIVQLVNNVKQVENPTNSLNSTQSGETAVGNNVQINSPEIQEKQDPPVNGVIQINLSDLLNPNGTIKPVNQLQSLFESKGISQNDIVLFYNTDTGNLAFLTLMMNMAGYNNVQDVDSNLTQVVTLRNKLLQQKEALSQNATSNTNNSNANSNTTTNINDSNANSNGTTNTNNSNVSSNTSSNTNNSNISSNTTTNTSANINVNNASDVLGSNIKTQL
ncbi:MAG: sulfurtransferase [Sarcina sp.]